jgi:hypothetical protein
MIGMNEIARVMRKICIPKQKIVSFMNAETFEDAENLLSEIKIVAKKNWKKMAFELHPDRNGGDSSEFIRVKDAYDIVMKVRIVKPTVVRTVFVRSYCTGGYGTGDYYTSTTTSVYGW